MFSRVSRPVLAIVYNSKTRINELLSGFVEWLLQGARWESFILIALIIAAPFLVFYNLEYNPRPWHDEGSLLSVPRTLIEEGIYARRSSDGYQTYGAVQSVGPTVLLPVALSFKLFGIGLIQGRIVVAAYALLTLALFYRSGQELFGRRTALLAVVLLLGSPAVAFLLLGRQVAGDVPALGFFLGGWLLWSRGVRTGRQWLFLIAGLLFGAAMVTKMQYIPMGFGTLALVAILDLLFYRQRNTVALITVGLVAFACVAAWYGWQLAYYGVDTFQENAAKFRQLAAGTTGFDPRMTLMAIKFLIGSQSGHFYYFWGFAALMYAGMLSLRRNQDGFVLAFLLIFASLWLGFYLFWMLPVPQYVYAPAAISALFVGKLWNDLAGGFATSWRGLWVELRQGRPVKASFTSGGLMALGTLMALMMVGLMVGYQLQRDVRTYVLDREGRETDAVRTPRQLKAPCQLAAFLNETVDRDSVIETWELELSILTDHRYHFPDQGFLAKANAAVYRGGPRDYALGEEYFRKHLPDYVVVGWFARYQSIYDTEFLVDNGDLLATIGDDDWSYEIYRLHLP